MSRLIGSLHWRGWSAEHRAPFAGLVPLGRATEVLELLLDLSDVLVVDLLVLAGEVGSGCGRLTVCCDADRFGGPASDDGEVGCGPGCPAEGCVTGRLYICTQALAGSEVMNEAAAHRFAMLWSPHCVLGTKVWLSVALHDRTTEVACSLMVRLRPLMLRCRLGVRDAAGEAGLYPGCPAVGGGAYRLPDQVAAAWAQVGPARISVGCSSPERLCLHQWVEKGMFVVRVCAVMPCRYCTLCAMFHVACTDCISEVWWRPCLMFRDRHGCPMGEVCSRWLKPPSEVLISWLCGFSGVRVGEASNPGPLRVASVNVTSLAGSWECVCDLDWDLLAVQETR